MAFDYGSIDLGIENPFKIEGTIQSIVGFLIFFLGVLSLFSVQGQIENKGQEAGVYLTIVGVWLIGWGLTKLSKGLFQVFRFFVGRSVPANLAKNWEKSQADKQDISLTYTHQQLEQMLQGRQNISFKEPGDWFSRLIHSIFPRLLYLPLAYRNMSLRIARAVVQTLIVLLVFWTSLVQWYYWSNRHHHNAGYELVNSIFGNIPWLGLAFFNSTINTFVRPGNNFHAWCDNTYTMDCSCHIITNWYCHIGTMN